LCIEEPKLIATYAGHYERPPYNEDTIRSVYHVRHYDVLKLMHLKEPLDIFLSHDWPLGITEYGNWQKLISVKKHFEEEVMPTGLLDWLILKLNASLFPLYHMLHQNVL
jgi:hypothetical protein